jgi:hypothetical protein
MRSVRAVMPLPVALAALAIALLAGPAWAGVIVADSSGGGDYTTITAAVTAAVDGDTLLIRGTFDWPDGVNVNGKSLVFVGDPAGAVIAGVDISNVPAGGRVVVRGLTISPLPFNFASPGVTLTNNAGSVWIEDCSAEGWIGNGQAPFCAGVLLPGGAGIQITNCASVVVARCQLLGGVGQTPSLQGSVAFQRTDGGAGALISGSKVAFYGCELSGGQGAAGAAVCSEPPTDGGNGVSAGSSQVLLSGCSIVGGLPGSGTGGDGLVLDAASIVHEHDTTIAAGPGGTAIVNGGVLDSFPGVTRSFELSSPLREGQGGTLEMHGVQGDFVAFFWSFGAAAIPMPARNGWFVLNPSFLAGPFLLGAITDPGGTWILNVTGPNLPPASEAQTFLLQAYFAYPGGVTLGSGTAFTLVDSTL